jgi:hypothetical protein
VQTAQPLLELGTAKLESGAVSASGKRGEEANGLEYSKNHQAVKRIATILQRGDEKGENSGECVYFVF